MPLHDDLFMECRGETCVPLFRMREQPSDPCGRLPSIENFPSFAVTPLAERILASNSASGIYRVRIVRWYGEKRPLELQDVLDPGRRVFSLTITRREGTATSIREECASHVSRQHRNAIILNIAEWTTLVVLVLLLVYCIGRAGRAWRTKRPTMFAIPIAIPTVMFLGTLLVLPSGAVGFVGIFVAPITALVLTATWALFLVTRKRHAPSRDA